MAPDKPDTQEETQIDRQVFNAAIEDMLNQLAARENGKLSPEEAKFFLGQISGIRGIINEMAQNPALRPYEQIDLDQRGAYAIMSKAKQEAVERIEKREKEEGEVADSLKKILDTIYSKFPGKKRPKFDEETENTLYINLAQSLRKLRRPSSKDIATTIFQHQLVRTERQGLTLDIIQEFFLMEKSEEGNGNFDALISHIEELKGKLSMYDGVSESYIKLRKHYFDYYIEDAARIWSETEREKDPALRVFAEEANEAFSELFPDKSFHPVVKEAIDIRTLQTLMDMPPHDSESFVIFKHVIAKLELMRILREVASMDIPLQQKVSIRLKERFDRIVDGEKWGGVTILNPPTAKKEDEDMDKLLDKDEKHIEIDRVEIDTEAKSVVSSARKMILAGIHKWIADKIRGRMFLPPHLYARKIVNGKVVWDKETLDRLHEIVTKVLAILLAEFGNDIDISRVRYTILEGGTNEHSTGEHRGIHITITLKFEIPAMGVDDHGQFKKASKRFEFQILSYQSEDEEKKDHASYLEAKKYDIERSIGVDLSFKDYILQLAEVINTEHDFGENFTPSKGTRFGGVPFDTNHLRERLHLLRILSERKEDSRKIIGGLINREVIEEIMGDPDQRKLMLSTLQKAKFAPKIKNPNSETRKLIKEITKIAAEMRKILRSGNIDGPKIEYSAEWSRAKIQLSEKRKYGGGVQDMEVKMVYDGVLYLIRKIEKEATRFYEVVGGQTKPRLAYEITGEKGKEKCYKVGPRGGKTLAWEIGINDHGQKVYKLHEEGIEMPVTEKQQDLNPVIGLRMTAKERAIQDAINAMIIKRNIRPQGGKLILL